MTDFKINIEQSIIYTKKIKLLIKFFLALSSIAFIVFGLNMIDESCGCVRYQDTYMSLMLKAYVFCAILLFLTSFLFTNNYPRISIFIVAVLSLTLLVLSSWIFYYYKGCIAANRVQSTDRRFLGWNVASMVLSSSILLLSIVVTFYVFRKSDYNSPTSQIAKTIKTKMFEIDNVINQNIKPKLRAEFANRRHEDPPNKIEEYTIDIETKLKQYKSPIMDMNAIKKNFKIYNEADLNPNDKFFSETINKIISDWVNLIKNKIDLKELIKTKNSCNNPEQNTCAQYIATLNKSLNTVDSKIREIKSAGGPAVPPRIFS